MICSALEIVFMIKFERKNINLRLLKWQLGISVSLIVFIIGCFTTYVIFIKNDLFLSQTDIVAAIITGVGSALGGLIGGVVAFGIARSQFLEDNRRDNQNKNQIYLNLIKSLKIELKHNNRILKMLESDISKKDSYVYLLESEAWNNIKYNNNNFLPMQIYEIIDEVNREFIDMRMKSIQGYDELKSIDFESRSEVINILLKKLEAEEDKLNS